MARPGRALLALLAAAAAQHGSAARVVASANPIRRVVNMLQMMQQKVTAEGAKEESLFDKFMCYCDTSIVALKKSFSAAETKLPELESSLKENQAEVARLNADVAQSKTDLTDAESALQQSTDIAAKEHAENLAEISDYQNNLKALGKAIDALTKSSSGSTKFLQTSAASTLRQLTVSLDMSTSDRDMISAFLGQSEGYQPQNGEVVGILKQMQEEMTTRLQEVEAKDKANQQQSKDMIKAKQDQIAALRKQIDSKTARLGQLAVDVVNLQGDYDDTSKSYQQDQKFLADLQAGCSTKKDEWAVRQKMRSQELQAISETIKTLNDDEALELFKKSLPTPSFLQIEADPEDGARHQALRAVRAAKRAGRGQHGSRLEMLSIALRSKKVNFSKITKMLDDMITLLDKEQADDDQKKDYCKSEIDQSDDQIKDVTVEISDLGKAREEAKQKIATLISEVDGLSQGIQQLDKQVQDSTQQRKDEHADYVEKLSTNTATKELLNTAKKILGKFYKPSTPAVFAQADDEEQSPFFVQLASRSSDVAAAAPAAAPPASPAPAPPTMTRVPPPPPPATWSGDYNRQEAGSLGVVQMIEQLSNDLTQDSAQLQTVEKDSQFQYEKSMADAASKRASDARVISEKEAVKAELEARLHKMNQESKSKEKESTSLKEYAKDLHNECDWLMANFGVRRDARTGEIESLRQAKAVLNGANFGSNP